MSSKEISLRLSTTLLVLSRRGIMNDGQLSYINTKEISSYYNDNKTQIEKCCCDLYGKELMDAIKRIDPSDINIVIEDITKYHCYDSLNIHQAIQLLVDNYELFVDNYLLKLSKYVTIDNLISSISKGNIDLYEEIKMLLSSRPIEGIDSPPFTMSALTLEEVSTLAIVYSVVYLALKPSNDRLYIMRDILRYIEYSRYINSERLNVIVNEIGKSLSRGQLLSWNVSLLEKAETNSFNIPNPSIDEQIYLYNEEFRHILASYPKPHPRIKTRQD